MIVSQSRSRGHIREGNIARAEELAYEVDQIQCAHKARYGLGEEHEGEWVLPLDVWCEKIIHGTRLSRYFCGATNDGTHETATSEAIRIHRLSLSDALRVTPRYRRA